MPSITPDELSCRDNQVSLTSNMTDRCLNSSIATNHCNGRVNQKFTNQFLEDLMESPLTDAIRLAPTDVPNSLIAVMAFSLTLLSPESPR